VAKSFVTVSWTCINFFVIAGRRIHNSHTCANCNCVSWEKMLHSTLLNCTIPFSGKLSPTWMGTYTVHKFNLTDFKVNAACFSETYADVSCAAGHSGLLRYDAVSLESRSWPFRGLWCLHLKCFELLTPSAQCHIPENLIVSITAMKMSTLTC